MGCNFCFFTFFRSRRTFSRMTCLVPQERNWKPNLQTHPSDPNISSFSLWPHLHIVCELSSENRRDPSSRWLTTNRSLPLGQVTSRLHQDSAHCLPPRSARPSWARLRARPPMISHLASRYWLGVLEAYTKTGSGVTDCVLQRTLSLHSRREGQQNFLGQEMETATQAGSIWLDSLKR